MVDRDVVFAKIGIIKRCLKRISLVTALDPNRLDDIDRQDIFVLNLQRAVQAAIDLAAHIVASEGFGVPQDMKEHFRFLRDNTIIDHDLCEKMERMIGFRNIAVHEYQEINLDILRKILVSNLKDLEVFYTAIVKHFHLSD
ncbi:MAG: DUF86 domain-containing protein [bacterium]